MSVIGWEEPPPNGSHAAGRKNTKWHRIAEELRAKPSQWAHIENRSAPNIAAQVAMQIRRGHCSGMPAGQFEAVSRLVDGEYRVYARYVGEVS